LELEKAEQIVSTTEERPIQDSAKTATEPFSNNVDDVASQPQNQTKQSQRNSKSRSRSGSSSAGSVRKRAISKDSERISGSSQGDHEEFQSTYSSSRSEAGAHSPLPHLDLLNLPTSVSRPPSSIGSFPLLKNKDSVISNSTSSAKQEAKERISESDSSNSSDESTDSDSESESGIAGNSISQPIPIPNSAPRSRNSTPSRSRGVTPSRTPRVPTPSQVRVPTPVHLSASQRLSSNRSPQRLPRGFSDIRSPSPLAVVTSFPKQQIHQGDTSVEIAPRSEKSPELASVEDQCDSTLRPAEVTIELLGEPSKRKEEHLNAAPPESEPESGSSESGSSEDSDSEDDEFEDVSTSLDNKTKQEEPLHQLPAVPAGIVKNDSDHIIKEDPAVEAIDKKLLELTKTEESETSNSEDSSEDSSDDESSDSESDNKAETLNSEADIHPPPPPTAKLDEAEPKALSIAQPHIVQVDAHKLEPELTNKQISASSSSSGSSGSSESESESGESVKSVREELQDNPDIEVASQSSKRSKTSSRSNRSEKSKKPRLSLKTRSKQKSENPEVSGSEQSEPSVYEPADPERPATQLQPDSGSEESESSGDSASDHDMSDKGKKLVRERMGSITNIATNNLRKGTLDTVV